MGSYITYEDLTGKYYIDLHIREGKFEFGGKRYLFNELDDIVRERFSVDIIEKVKKEILYLKLRDRLFSRILVDIGNNVVINVDAFDQPI